MGVRAKFREATSGLAVWFLGTLGLPPEAYGAAVFAIKETTSSWLPKSALLGVVAIRLNRETKQQNKTRRKEAYIAKKDL